MALTTAPVFPQAPKTAGISFAGSTNTTQMDPATVAPTTLLTAGADGAVVTSIVVHAEATVTAEKVCLWVQLAGAGSWYLVRTAVLAAYTQAATDAQGSIALIDKSDATNELRLAAGDKLGVTHHVDQQLMVLAEYTNF